MAETLTSILKTDTVRMFYDDLQDNQYYVFVSSVTGIDEDRIEVNNSIKSKNIFLDNVIFGKKILNDDCKFMVKYYPWQSGQVFTQYDDSVDLDGERFYCVVGPNINDTGDYRVYKCLYNNNNSSVTTAPNFDNTITDQIYRTADGYIWKYMYKITQAQFEAYNAVGYIPVVDEFQLAPFDHDANTANGESFSTTATGSKIDQIFVENAQSNAGYHRAKGQLTASPGNDGTLTLAPGLEFPLSRNDNFYSGMTIVLTYQGDTKLYKISTYEYDEDGGLNGTPVGRIQLATGEDPLGDGVNGAAGYDILPTIEITGDGTGAEAYPKLEDGVITQVIVTKTGSGYHTVSAKVVDPLQDFDPESTQTIDVRASIRPIMSPQGGHNTDRLEELKCRHVLLYGYITEDNNNQIGATNSYSHLAVVKEPEWECGANSAHPDWSPLVFDNRIKIVTNDYASVTVNETVTQVNSDNEVIFAAKVHEIKSNSNTIFLYDYNRTYQNQSNSDIAIDYTKDLQNESGVILEINTPVRDNVTESLYTQRSGLVYFMEDFTPLDRTSQSREEYKLLLEF